MCLKDCLIIWLMLKFQFENIEELKNLHYNAVEDYVKRLAEDIQDAVYASVIKLKGFEDYNAARNKADYTWLKQFILADLDTMRAWVTNQPDELKFTEFQALYGSKFSNGIDNFVDSAGTYNAYTLIENMNLNVCPYCDDEYLDVVKSDDKTRRTSEFDHFFPEGKSKYPALAMCFYNLVLSGQNCNGLKLQKELGASPYDEDIEKLTFLYPDLDIGVNMDSVTPNECEVLLHAKGGMVTNEKVLGLKERYANRKGEAYQLLKRKQQFPDEKLDEMIRMGIIDSKKEILDVLFGSAYEEGKFKELHQKMKHDLTGY